MNQMFNSKKLLDSLMKRGISYSDSLRILREVLRLRREKIFFSIEFSEYGIVLYSEEGKEFSLPIWKGIEI